MLSVAPACMLQITPAGFQLAIQAPPKLAEAIERPVSDLSLVPLAAPLLTSARYSPLRPLAEGEDNSPTSWAPYSGS